ncbi:hypothetical protein BaRGS_00033127, partial [Batillaria attramentaria]
IRQGCRESEFRNKEKCRPETIHVTGENFQNKRDKGRKGETRESSKQDIKMWGRSAMNRQGNALGKGKRFQLRQVLVSCAEKQWKQRISGVGEAARGKNRREIKGEF